MQQGEPVDDNHNESLPYLTLVSPQEEESTTLNFTPLLSNSEMRLVPTKAVAGVSTPPLATKKGEKQTNIKTTQRKQLAGSVDKGEPEYKQLNYTEHPCRVHFLMYSSDNQKYETVTSAPRLFLLQSKHSAWGQNTLHSLQRLHVKRARGKLSSNYFSKATHQLHILQYTFPTSRNQQ